MKKKLLIIVLLGCLVLPVSAIEKYTKDYTKLYSYVLNEEKRPEVTHELRQSIIDLFSYQRQRNEWANAAKSLDYAIDLTEQLYGVDEHESLLFKLTRVEHNSILGFFRQSMDECDEVSHTAQRRGYTDLIESSIFNKANLYMLTEQPLKAIEYYNKISQKTDYDSWVTSEIFINKSRMYMNLSETKKAIDILNNYYNSLKNPNDVEKYVYNNALAEIYLRIGRYDLAMKHIAKAETYVLKIDETNKRLLIGIKFVKSKIYRETDNFDETQKIFNEIKYYLDEGVNNGETENLYSNNLDYYNDTLDLENFNKYYKKLENHYKDYPKTTPTVIQYKEKKIRLLQKLDKTDDAIAVTNEVLEQLEPVKNDVPAFYGRILSLAADNQLKKGNSTEAKKYLDMAAESFKKAEPETAYEFQYINYSYGEILKKEGNIHEAIKHFNKSMQYAQKAQNEKDLVYIYTNLSYLYADMYDKAKALEYVDKAIESAAKCYGNNSSLTYDKMIMKYNLYNRFSMTEDADILLNEINNKISINGITGNKERIKNTVDTLYSYQLTKSNDIHNALNYAKEAKINAKTDTEKQNVKKLYYDIYSNNGNKIKALRYKK